MIVINSVDVASKLLQSRGTIYSDRPSSHFHGDLVGWGEVASVMNEGPEVRRFRRHFIQEIGGKHTLGRFTPVIDARIQDFLHNILGEREPTDNLHNHISTYVDRLAKLDYN
jgi:hypothetical protein